LALKAARPALAPKLQPAAAPKARRADGSIAVRFSGPRLFWLSALARSRRGGGNAAMISSACAALAAPGGVGRGLIPAGPPLAGWLQLSPLMQHAAPNPPDPRSPQLPSSRNSLKTRETITKREEGRRLTG
jgi:hypothetical protein